jgi:hypothetical protein
VNRFLILTSSFLVVVGARLWLISVFGSALPIHDQWDAEAAYLFKPWLEGHLAWSDLFRPHNEHRIVLSRLLALGLFLLNGQWDAQLEMAANAILCGVLAVATTAAAGRFFSRQTALYIAAAIILWLALPYAQENTLWGFQSCFYFMLIFSLATIWGLSFHRAFSFPWWFGGISAVLACVSMAAGFLAAATVLALAGIRYLRQRTWTSERTAIVGLAGLVLLLGFFLHHEVPHHAMLKAASPLAWASVFGRALGWPFCSSAAAALLIYWPLCSLLVLYLRPGKTAADDSHELRQHQMELFLALGFWVILQAAAIAYSRGADGTVPIAARYTDILALGALVNVGAVAILIGCLPHRKTLILACSLWIAAVAAGAVFSSYQELSSQAGRQAWLQTAAQNVRAYVATGDKKYVEGDPPPRIPYPVAWRLASLLDDPVIRQVLPSAVRRPLRVEAEAKPENAFTPGGHPPEVENAPYERSWGSYSARASETLGSLETASLAPKSSHLRIELAGYLREGMTLDLRSTTGDKQSRFIPTTRLDPNWRAGFIPVPGREVKIVARDDNPHDWFAFREPREVGRFSVYAMKLVDKGQLLCALGLICLCAAFGHRALNGITNRRKT